MNKPSILFFADTTHHTGAVQDHIQAITNSPDIHWHIVNPLVLRTIDTLDFSVFDGIGIHYSIKPYNNYYLSASLKNKIAQFPKLKFLFLQDEYQRVNQVQEYMFTLGFHILFTLVNQSIIHKAYPDPRLKNLKKITVLTGYVQDYMHFCSGPSIAKRSIHVSYRARKCDYYLGSLAHEKQVIADKFLHYASNSGLKLDISTNETDRIYGQKWLDFLANCKAVLCTESGASIWDFDQKIEKEVSQFMKKNRDASFDKVYENILKKHEGEITYNAISPRVFEAAATKTAMVMFPGYYSGVCIPHKHYIVLEKDFSNVQEVIEKLKDDNFLTELVDNTFNDLIASGLYSQHSFSSLISEEILNTVNTISSENPENIKLQINAIQNQKKLINNLRKLGTELIFILQNIYTLIFDEKYSLKTKCARIFLGCKRYITYLLPRI